MIVTGRRIQLTIVLMLLGSLVGCDAYTAGPPIDSNMPEKYAFLIIDIQKDFMMADGKLPVDRQQAQRVLKTINTIIETVDVNTMEIVYIGNEFSPSDRIANWFRNDAAIKGEEGSKLDSRLKVVNNLYYSKDRPDAFSNNAFDQYLRNRKVNKILIAGVFADQCVLATAKGAMQRGYQVTLLSDGVAAKNDKKLKKALQKHLKSGTIVISSAELLKKLDK